MNDDEILKKLKENGLILIPESFLQAIIDAIHDNNHTVNLMTDIEELRDGAMTENLRLLSNRLSEIAFTLEGVVHDQRD